MKALLLGLLSRGIKSLRDVDNNEAEVMGFNHLANIRKRPTPR
jgi:hypothetical protein